MPPLAHNACQGCTKAKRACDRQLPVCTRCAERALHCLYPARAVHPSHRRRRLEDGRVISSLASPASQGALASALPNFELPLDEVSDMLMDEVDESIPPSVSEVATVSGRSPTPGCLHTCQCKTQDASNHTRQHETPAATSVEDLTASWANKASASCPIIDETGWFLAQQTWQILRWPPLPSAAFRFGIFRDFIRDLRSWVFDWVKHGRNVFIHPKLYRSGLPSCLQDAFTTLAAYLARNRDTEEMVLQTMEDRVEFLVLSQEDLAGVDFPPAEVGAMGAEAPARSTIDVRSHLARTQALLVYTTVRLFDGCPRHRTQAESLLPTLQKWSLELWNAVIRCIRSAVFSAPGLTSTGEIQFPRELHMADFSSATDPTILAWDLWVLTESIRRTRQVVATLVFVYLVLRDGWADCTGSNLFTARKGLWDAGNAATWAAAAKKEKTLFITFLSEDGKLLNAFGPSEVDGFTKALLPLFVEEDELKCWLARERTVEDEIRHAV